MKLFFHFLDADKLERIAITPRSTHLYSERVNQSNPYVYGEKNNQMEKRFIN